MKLWPFADVKKRDLQDLEKTYQDTNFADNFRLRAAMATKNEFDRAMQLSQLADKIDDAAIVANYELALLALKLENRPEWSKMNLKTAERYFEVSKSAQDNPYRIPSEQYLAWLAGRKQTDTMPTEMK